MLAPRDALSRPQVLGADLLSGPIKRAQSVGRIRSFAVYWPIQRRKKESLLFFTPWLILN